MSSSSAIIPRGCTARSRREMRTMLVPAALALTTVTPSAHAIEEIVITAVRMENPLTLVTDPKAPRQPLPAHDGGDYLKTIPGFSLIRKGGTDGDPVFRGMAASRINILLDGESVLGGCGNRMDPPTAYVFPESYDQITVVKGPQTVTHGPGNSAATVAFEHTSERLEALGYKANASILGASSGRIDLVGDLLVGAPLGYGRVTATRAEAGNYSTGRDAKVHSAYERWGVTAAFGWTPDADTLVEVSGARSDGEAAYADRGMDGALFDRENIGLRLERRNLSEHLTRITAQGYYNYVDHVMDNYSLRDFMPSAMMPGKAASNPDRRTAGGRIALDLAITGTVTATVGADVQDNAHSVRSTGNQDVNPFESMARVDDAWFRNVGLFGETTWAISERDRVVSGVRVDFWDARDERATVSTGMSAATNPTRSEHREQTLPNGFARVEHELTTQPAVLYLGIGHVQRFPDYWELISKESTGSLSAFRTPVERTTQLDSGITWRGEQWAMSLSAFANDIEDYILIESGYRKGMRSTTVTRSVDARTWGGEVDSSYSFAPGWRIGAALSYTRGVNETEDRPLAQMPPLELRTTLNYAGTRLSAGLLWRLVADQNRFAARQGNIVGQDLGPTQGFGVLSLNGTWKATRQILVSAGVDNVLDQDYAEHLSRAGAMVSGFTQTTRVNEPGRTFWFKVSGQF